MANTMHPAVVEQLGRLLLREISIPEPGPGRILVKTKACGANCVTVRGSFVGTQQDMAEALAFAADGRVYADIELQPLSAVNTIFDRPEHGDVPSRVVIDLAGGA